MPRSVDSRQRLHDPSHRCTRSLGLALILLASACASLPYEPGTCSELDPMPLREAEPQVERGNRRPFLDYFASYFIYGLLSKITLLNVRVDNHRISPETEAALVEYLKANQLCHVKVRINQYSVPGEWSRLVRNKNVSGFWRYTLGAYTLAIYTALPQRFFGGDNYNPYTNTINIYSNVPAIALHEGGHAKDFARRRYKGWYAFFRLLPLVPLWQEGIASKDAVSYQRAKPDVRAERSSYPILWAAYSTYIFGEALDYYSGPSPYAQFLVIPFAWVGKAGGFVKSLTVSEPDVLPEPQAAPDTQPSEP
jgi:hypothetical protein